DRVREDLREPRGEVWFAGAVRRSLTSSPSSAEDGPQPIPRAVGPDREMGLDAELERDRDPAVRSGDGAEPIVDGIAERLGRGIEPAHVQEHRVRGGAEDPAAQVVRAVEPL